jgi:3-isopropylmalate/(R)-2-methylmalate dehydratase small subunit
MKALGRVFKYGDNVDTDVIIPARYLNSFDGKELAKHAMVDIDPEFVSKVQPGDLIVANKNFGCGSSREHAPWALEVNGIYVVVATNFARIFRQNMYNCGMLAIEMDKKSIEDMFKTFGDKETECKIVINDDDTAKVKLIAGSLSKSYPFKLEGFEKALIENEGWIGYADSKY